MERLLLMLGKKTKNFGRLVVSVVFAEGLQEGQDFFDM
jgi:hypothetical protein